MKFSDVAEAYNANVSNIDQARLIFEEETHAFIQTVSILANTEIKKSNNNASFKDKRLWKEAETTNSKGATPLGFYSECRLFLAIKPAGSKNFKNKAAVVSFQISYDESIGQFSFKGILTNTDDAYEMLDEKLAEAAQAAMTTLDPAFKNFEVHKTREYVAFKLAVTNDLWQGLGKLIPQFFEISDRAISAVFEDVQAQRESNPTVALKQAG